jgi:hypothetical protein
MNVGSNKTSSKSSGKDEKDIDKFNKRYKEQEDAIDNITESVEDLNREMNRLYGANRIKYMDEIIKKHKEE